jgi:hypothetical protein
VICRTAFGAAFGLSSQVPAFRPAIESDAVMGILHAPG